MKLSEWTYDAVFNAVILLGFWACCGIIVVSILAILFLIINWIWELIQDNIWWPIFVKIQDHKERKWNERQKIEREVRRQEADTKGRPTNTHRH